MKTKIKIISLFIMLSIGAYISPQKASAQGGYVSYQVFYDDLSPYGTWVNMNDYGYVWVPDATPGFTPYSTNGYWVYTDMGWTWVSNYPWGWAPFHYGRWLYNPTYGQVWIPGYEWGPGWVTWRSSDNYYGWAPMGPSGYYNVPYNQWTFVNSGYLGRQDINNYYVNNSNNVTIINNTTVINNYRKDQTRNTTYNAGPNITDVERHAGKKITPLIIKESSKPGQSLSNNQLQIYRPQVKKNAANGQKPTPSKVAGIKDVKTLEQRKTTPQNPGQKSNQAPNQNQYQTKPAGQQNQQKQTQTKPSGQQNQQKQIQTRPSGQQGQQNQQKQIQTKPSGQQPQQNQPQTKPAGQQNQQKQMQTKPSGQQPRQNQPQTKPSGQQNQQKPSQPQKQQTKQQPSHQQANPNQNQGGEKNPK
jgi:hypothetical protein